MIETVVMKELKVFKIYEKMTHFALVYIIS